ncbi:hypothetical protein PFICI_02462 [Pestalotiopsis fici W106-1]|uniref:L-ascorbate oxidase n=1 Tax=Pestalotiopsis fici (strain W106-1 / CGMCC3.15140) TaxID=1229662 RepID=W3XG86_PESFW|nr:uncharacterized protein PFICI_02462 [Pestalotiopsis fici W106-1]ETS84437.1 hypothetical protein PFICI_02462 [Pestalotiopsis fici W106-1]
MLRAALHLTTVVGLLVPFGLAAGVHKHDQSFTPDYALHVTYEKVDVACRTKLLGLVNGTSPGPPLYMKEGETTWHWHGLAQATAPFSDGTPQASQWAIAPGHFFDYEIQPRIGEAGSYFYHSHVLFQASSIVGPIIVEEASGEPPYRYDEEKIVFLSDYFNWTDEAVVAEAGSHLINGGTYPPLGADETQTDEPWQESPANDKCKPEVFQVEFNKTYRLRMIGAVVASTVSLVIEDHDRFDVINADGAYTKPAEVDRIQLGSGQRFDVLLRTKTEDEVTRLGKSLFWVQVESRYRPVNVTSYAFLQYTNSSVGNRTVPASAPATPPLEISNDIQGWLEYTLEPLEDNGFPAADQVSRTVYLYSSQIFANSTPPFWAVNNRTWTDENQHLGGTPYYDMANNTGTPYLVDIYKNGEAAMPNYDLAVGKYGGWDPNLNVYTAKVGEIIDVVLINEPTGTVGGFDVHPWHIHGGHVYDLGSGPGNYDAAANEKRLQGYHPVLRDTLMLYKYVDSNLVGENGTVYTPQGWRAWRIKVQDAGVWMVHCHLLYHMIMGMQTVWVMGNASEITVNSEPYVKGYLDYGGSAYGNASYDPLVYHHFSD